GLRITSRLLVARQLFPDQAREIWVLVHGAGALVDQAALLEFAKRQSTRGDGVTFIKHFVGFPINEHTPIPWRAMARRTLGTDVCGAIRRDGVIPARMIVEHVKGVYVFQKPHARLCR